MPSPITTHVLDTSRGCAAGGIVVALEIQNTVTGSWKKLAIGTTNSDGRIPDLLPENFALQSGQYRLIFESGQYFRALGVQGFYPQVTVTFEIQDASQHFHVPLLLSPFGYSTYRGS